MMLFKRGAVLAMFSRLRDLIKSLRRSSSFKLGLALFLVFALVLIFALGAAYFELHQEISKLRHVRNDVREEITDIIGNILSSVLLSALLIGIIIIAWFAYNSEKRIRRINHTLSELAAGDLSARIEMDKPKDDLDNVALEINKTAEKLQLLLAQTRQLGASIAHDLRTPLARLRVQLEQLESDDEAGVDALLEEVDHLARIIDAILRIARVEARTGCGAWREAKLEAFAQEFCENFEPVVEAQGRSLRVVMDAPSVPVSFDPDLLNQAMANLLQNALIYGEGAIEIIVSGREIGLCDEGAGVPEDKLDEIIKPMVRLDQTRQTQGSGLGLALVKAVADHHQAELILRNRPNSGLDVRICFPD